MKKWMIMVGVAYFGHSVLADVLLEEWTYAGVANGTAQMEQTRRVQRVRVRAGVVDRRDSCDLQ